MCKWSNREGLKPGKTNGSKRIIKEDLKEERFLSSSLKNPWSLGLSCWRRGFTGERPKFCRVRIFLRLSTHMVIEENCKFFPLKREENRNLREKERSERQYKKISECQSGEKMN